MKAKIASIFNQHFEGNPLIVRSPGRINIIGEHVDYNGGYVLPAAIDKYIYVAISKRNDDRIGLYSVNFESSVEIALNDIKPSNDYSTYILGVVDQLLQRGFSISGFNMVIDGDIPVGAGLSSSAALESAVAFALNELFQLGISRLDLVLIAQKAESTFAGVHCGVMDMFASIYGVKDSVIKLDCDSLLFEYMPLKLDGYSLVLFNTNVKHSLASSAYNVRREQCETGLNLIKQIFPDVKTFKDVTENQLTTYVLPYDKEIFNRCFYVVKEIQRLNEACQFLQKGDLQALGKHLYATHEGLSKEYDVSCFELDYLINAVKSNPNVLGARMMGGGFGGCTLNIIKNEEIDSLSNDLSLAYEKETRLILDTIKVNTSNGTELVT
ncbi:galactokinase [Aquirufa sp.]|jgi:galactokinase|uniref:galactokinase n=1 Tax=Aquirufa sp. TaxID=2676249 RepID=UPI0037BEE0C3